MVLKAFASNRFKEKGHRIQSLYNFFLFQYIINSIYCLMIHNHVKPESAVIFTKYIASVVTLT